MTLVGTAATRLKSLLPSLADAPGSVRSELFIVYSVLKHLAREMECRRASEDAKRAALVKFVQALRRLARVHSEEAWARRLGRLVEADQAGNGGNAGRDAERTSLLVAAVMDEIGETDCPDWVADQVMGRTVECLAALNAIEMSAYRDDDQRTGPAGEAGAKRGGGDDA